MKIDFSDNYFELFGLAVSFDVDEAKLSQQRRSLQQSLHPDNFAGGSDAEKRFSMQAASLINEAYKVLSEPLQRATYLLKLEDIDLDVETDTRMAPEFLMAQMEFREELETIESASDPYAKVESIRRSLDGQVSEASQSFSKTYGNADFVAARESTRQWQFLNRLQQELDDIEADMDDAL